MNARRYPECEDWRGFGGIYWIGPRRYRVLGMAGKGETQRVRIEWLDDPKNPRVRSWAALEQLPEFATSLRKTGMIDNVPADYLATHVPKTAVVPSQGALFRGLTNK